MVTIENEDSLKAALSRGINLFLGAGFSVLAASKDGRSLPVGDKLKKELIDIFELPELAELPLSRVCTIIEASRKLELRQYFQQRYCVEHYDDNYNVLNKLNIKSIYTTNIDDLLYKLFSSSSNHYLNDVTLHGPVQRDRHAIDLVPLHGSITNMSESLTFSTVDIATAFSSDSDKWHFLTEGMQHFPTLFWGYGVEDAGTLEALNPSTIHGREMKPKWIVLISPSEATRRYFEAIHFNIILANTQEMLTYLATLNIQQSSISTSAIIPTQELFPDDALPAIGSVPVRSLREFYLGQPPSWFDIFNNRIYKNKYYSDIVNSIDASRNTIVLGIPACGKTTLLMQVANGLEYEGHKLVCDSLTVEKAQLIISRLEENKGKAVVFVDDFADNAEAFTLLSKSRNILAVGFDREHNFDIAIHKFDRKLYKIIDVTDIPPEDIQEIYAAIPEDIRTLSYKEPKMHSGVELSVFEVIQMNIQRPSLSRRFGTLLRKLEQEPDLLELLVMLAYVQVCRTVVSFDMALAFLRDSVVDYQGVYEMMDKLGKLVAEYSGQDLGSPRSFQERSNIRAAETRDLEAQDYWVPRSNIVAAAILDQVSSEVFKRALIRFHRSVTPYRVINFNVFKTYAFDKNYALKAFMNWEEGRDFYLEVAHRDLSPYLWQQGALYLLHKKRFDEAFAWIDKALSMSGSRIVSIRHAHAIILFNANINKMGENSQQVRETLDKSMEILEQCHASDRRKTYHATAFADQALRYL